VATINQHRQLHTPWAAKVIQTFEGGSDGPSSEEHIINQNDCCVGDVARDVTERNLASWA
jgi:hypothetical protein